MSKPIILVLGAFLLTGTIVAVATLVPNRINELANVENSQNSTDPNKETSLTPTDTSTSISPINSTISDSTNNSPVITVITPEGGAYTLESKISISWKLVNQVSSNSTIIISLISASDNTTIGSIGSVKPATEAYDWYGPIVTNSNGQKIAAEGDRYYKIKVSLYEGDKLITEDTSNNAFEYAYGGPPKEQQ